MSDTSPIYCGVPQGSVLGAVLKDTTCGSWDSYVRHNSYLLWCPIRLSVGTCIILHVHDAFRRHHVLQYMMYADDIQL